MLAIGFANKYYTLWNISECEHSTEFEKWTVKNYDYIKNISMELDKVHTLYPELVFVDGLKGKSHSFVVYGERESINNDIFNFGQYKYGKIANCSDIKYLRWFFNNTFGERKENVKAQLINLGLHAVEFSEGDFDFMDDVEYAEYLKKNEEDEKFIETLASGQPINVTFFSNIDSYGKYGIRFINYNNYTLKFDEIAERYYAGYYYYLPVINGKAKRVKGKDVIITDYTIEYNNENNEYIINVKNIEFKK